MTKYTCDEYYLTCPYRSDKEDESKLLGRSNKYYRHFCLSSGIYEGEACLHCIVDDSPRIKRQKIRNSKVKVVKAVES